MVIGIEFWSIDDNLINCYIIDWWLKTIKDEHNESVVPDEGLEMTYCGALRYLSNCDSLEELASHQEEVQSLCSSNHTVNDQELTSQTRIKISSQKNTPQHSSHDESDGMYLFFRNNTKTSRNKVQKNRIANKMSTLTKNNSTSVLLS